MPLRLFDGAVTLTAGDFNIVLGIELADVLQVGVGDKVTVTLAEGRVTPAGIMPRTKRFTVSGIYRVGMYEFDRRLAFINIGDAQKLYRLRNAVSLQSCQSDSAVARPLVDFLAALFTLFFQLLKSGKGESRVIWLYSRQELVRQKY